MRISLRVFVGLLAFQAFEIEFIKYVYRESGDSNYVVLFTAVRAVFTFLKPLGHAPRAF